MHECTDSEEVAETHLANAIGSEVLPYQIRVWRAPVSAVATPHAPSHVLRPVPAAAYFNSLWALQSMLNIINSTQCATLQS